MSGRGPGRRTTHSRRLHHDRDPARLDRLLHRERDLLREPLLHLQAAAERLGDPRELRDAQHEFVRDVRDRDLQEQLNERK